MDIYTLAGEAFDCFEVVRRDESDEDTEYTRTKDGTPEWVRELVQSAHGEMFPDDWRYECIRAALGWIHDNEPEEIEDAHAFADSHVDVYTIARFRWLASNLQRQFYCDDAVSEGFAAGFTGIASDSAGIASVAGAGQYMEASEVYAAVVSALQARLSDDA